MKLKREKRGTCDKTNGNKITDKEGIADGPGGRVRNVDSLMLGITDQLLES